MHYALGTLGGRTGCRDTQRAGEAEEQEEQEEWEEQVLYLGECLDESLLGSARLGVHRVGHKGADPSAVEKDH